MCAVSAAFVSVRHLGNVLVEIDGDGTRVESYFVSYHRIGANANQMQRGRIVDWLACRLRLRSLASEEHANLGDEDES